jgi:hypothetical protein
MPGVFRRIALSVIDFWSLLMSCLSSSFIISRGHDHQRRKINYVIFEPEGLKLLPPYLEISLEPLSVSVTILINYF